MVSRDEMTLPLLEVGESIAERYKEQSKRCELWWLYKALEYANDCDLAYRASRNKRLLVEVMLIRVAGLIAGGVQSKKVEPELPLITVAPTPGGQNDRQQISENRQQVIGNVQNEIRGARYETRDVEQKVGNTPIVVQMPKVVSVSLTASTKVEPLSLTSDDKSEVEDVVSSEPIHQELKQSDFTNDDLIRVWRLYAKKIEGELHTSNTMQNFLPKKGIGASVVVRLINTMQLESLSKHKRTLEQFLVKELNNSDIVVDFVVEENVNQPVFLTKDENFKRMQEINSDFKRLKSELGLEIV